MICAALLSYANTYATTCQKICMSLRQCVMSVIDVEIDYFASRVALCARVCFWLLCKCVLACLRVRVYMCKY